MQTLDEVRARSKLKSGLRVGDKGRVHRSRVHLSSPNKRLVIGAGEQIPSYELEVMMVTST